MILPGVGRSACNLHPAARAGFSCCSQPRCICKWVFSPNIFHLISLLSHQDAGRSLPPCPETPFSCISCNTQPTCPPTTSIPSPHSLVVPPAIQISMGSPESYLSFSGLSSSKADTALNFLAPEGHSLPLSV